MTDKKTDAMLMSLLSAAFYGAWGSLAELSLMKGSSPAVTGLFIFMAASILSFLLNVHISRPDPRWVIAGALFFAANLLLFSLMKSSLLSSAYVYVPSSIIVFFLLSSRGFPAAGRGRVLASLILIVAGMAIAQGVSSFRLLDVATGVSIAALYGLASYLTYASVSGGSNARESFWIMLTEFVLFSAASPFQLNGISAGAIMFSITGGITVSVGLLLELAAYVRLKGVHMNLRLVNLVNVITNFDIIIIILVSFLLGSYNAASMVALALVFAGTSYLYIGT